MYNANERSKFTFWTSHGTSHSSTVHHGQGMFFGGGVYDVAEIYVKDEEITYGEYHLFMCHYPMVTWNGSHRGSWNLFGHVHGGLSNKGVVKHQPTQLDVGVDCHNFTPISYQEVKELITKQVLSKI